MWQKKKKEEGQQSSLPHYSDAIYRRTWQLAHSVVNLAFLRLKLALFVAPAVRNASWQSAECLAVFTQCWRLSWCFTDLYTTILFVMKNLLSKHNNTLVLECWLGQESRGGGGVVRD